MSSSAHACHRRLFSTNQPRSPLDKQRKGVRPLPGAKTIPGLEKPPAQTALTVLTSREEREPTAARACGQTLRPPRDRSEAALQPSRSAPSCQAYREGRTKCSQPTSREWSFDPLWKRGSSAPVLRGVCLGLGATQGTTRDRCSSTRGSGTGPEAMPFSAACAASPLGSSFERPVLTPSCA